MEKYLNSLMNAKKISRRNVKVACVSGKGRLAFAARDFNPGNFVSGYASVVREMEDPDLTEQMIT